MSGPNHIKPMDDHYAVIRDDHLIGVVCKEGDYWEFIPLAGGPRSSAGLGFALETARNYEPTMSY